MFDKLKGTIANFLANLQGHGFVREPMKNVFILGGDIELNRENYDGLLEALKSAKEGERIYIVLLENEGGEAYVGYELHDAMLESKAIIHTEARVWAASAALDVLFTGDYVSLPKHNGSEGIGVAHLSYMGSADHKIRDPQTMKEDEEKMQFYRPFLTEQQWARVLNGEDVSVFGAEACSIAKNKTVDDDHHCVIKRDKSYD